MGTIPGSERSVWKKLDDLFGALTGTGIITAAAGDNVRSFDLLLTRPANTTVYTAGDVIGDVSAAVLKFLNVAKANGTGVRIDNIAAYTNDTGLTGKRLDVHFYSATITPIADNEPMVLADGNEQLRKGVLSLVFGTGTRAKVASDLFTNLELNPADRSVYVQVETPEGFTPSANSTWIRIKISCTLTN